MATTISNNIVRSNARRAIIGSAKNFLTTSLTFNQGDLLALDSTNHCLKVIAADADTATFVGVATQSIKNGLLLSPYSTSVDGSQAQTDFEGPVDQVEVVLTLNTGDAFHPGDKVYPLGASGGTQTVSSSSNTGARKPCGYFVGPTVASAAAGATGRVVLINQLVAWT